MTQTSQSALYRWLNRHWLAAAICIAIFALLLLPLLISSWTLPLLLIFVQTPIYMFHQVEEHTGDRFRIWVNNNLFHGVPPLTDEAILWINIPGVWGVSIVCLYLAAFVKPGWGLAIVYLVLVNGIIHIVGAIVKRGYNPGLWTGILLFLPSGIVALRQLAKSGATPLQNTIGFAIAVGIHVVIIIYTASRARQIRSACQ